MLASLLRAECDATDALRRAGLDVFELRDIVRAEVGAPGGNPSGPFEIDHAGAHCLARAQQMAVASGREADSIDLAVALFQELSVASALDRFGLDAGALASAVSRYRLQAPT